MTDPFVEIGIPTVPPSRVVVPLADDAEEMRERIVQALRLGRWLADKHDATEWPVVGVAYQPADQRRSDAEAPRERGHTPNAPKCQVHGTEMKIGAKGDVWFCSRRDARQPKGYCVYEVPVT